MCYTVKCKAAISAIILVVMSVVLWSDSAYCAYKKAFNVDRLEHIIRLTLDVRLRSMYIFNVADMAGQHVLKPSTTWKDRIGVA